MSIRGILLGSATAALCIFFATAQQVRAATLQAINKGTVAHVFTECINDGIALMVGQNPAEARGWYYAIDSLKDGVNGFQVGGNVYEIHSLAIKEQGDDIWVALNANMPLTGASAPTALDGNVGWGDLFFNFSGKDFTTASEQGNLFAVRFAGTNDSSAPSIGLYGNVTPKSVTNVNSGFSSLSAYNKYVATYGCQGPGCGPSMGDLPANTSYLDQDRSLNEIASGKFLTGITYVSTSELKDAGYDLSRFNGQHTIAFKFSKSAICQQGICQSIPEPSSVVGLAAIGSALALQQLRKQRR